MQSGGIVRVPNGTGTSAVVLKGRPYILSLTGPQGSLRLSPAIGSRSGVNDQPRRRSRSGDRGPRSGPRARPRQATSCHPDPREREPPWFSERICETATGNVYDLADGKIKRIRIFTDRNQALEAAGLRE
jgi:hypothetical protein